MRGCRPERQDADPPAWHAVAVSTRPVPDQGRLRTAILAALEQRGPQTADEIAAVLGAHPFGVARALQRLSNRGAVVSAGRRLERTSGWGSPRWVAVWARPAAAAADESGARA